MKCYVVKDLLPEYVEEVCSKETRREIEKHLAGCKDCRASFEAMEKEGEKEFTDLEIEPFQKIQNMVRREKKKKIALISCALIMLLAFTVLTLFQVKPELDGPNFDKCLYASEAKSIAQEIGKGNMEVILDGVVRTGDMVDSVNLEYYQQEGYLYQDVLERMNEVYQQNYKTTHPKVKLEDIYYIKEGYYGDMLSDGKTKYPRSSGVYCANVEITCNAKVMSLAIYFYSKNCFVVSAREETKEENAVSTLFTNVEYFAEIVLNRSSISEWLCSQIMEKGTSQNQFREVSAAFTSDCNQIGEGSAYEKKIEKMLPRITGESETVSFSFQMTGYERQKKAAVVKLFWEIKDTLGNSCIMTKEFYRGAFGLEPADDSETFLSNGNFDTSLQNSMAEIFDLPLN